MKERDKEYYNQKINELYNIIESRDRNINDLEKENRELKKDLEMYENGVYFSSENDELQQRIDKAIEYIEKEMPYLQETDKEYEDVNGNTYFTYKEYDGKELLDILKGE